MIFLWFNHMATNTWGPLTAVSISANSANIFSAFSTTVANVSNVGASIANITNLQAGTANLTSLGAINTYGTQARALGSPEPLAPGSRRFIIDFAGGDLPYFQKDPPLVEVVPSVTNGRILRSFLVPNGHTGGFRAALDVQLESGQSTDLRCFLRAGNRALTCREPNLGSIVRHREQNKSVTERAEISPADDEKERVLFQ